MKPLLIAIGGGTGSGKTTIAEQIIKLLDNQENTALINLDNYYKDLSHLSLEERTKVNFDHPDSLDWLLFKEHLTKLQNNEPIELHDYSFIINNRLPTTKTILPAKIMIFEGIFALCDEECNKKFNLRIYVDTDSDLRFIRRTERDIKERGRTYEFAVHSWLTRAKPMHELFVKPYKKHAHIIIPEHEREVTLKLIKEGLRGISNTIYNLKT